MDLYIEHALERTVRIAFSGQELGKSPVCSEADCTQIKAIDKDLARLPLPTLGVNQGQTSSQGNNRAWYVNSQGQTMVIVRGPVEFEMGEGASQHPERIGHNFAIATKEVTVEQFRRFLKENPRIQVWLKNADIYGSEPSCPIDSVTWYIAAGYCNWLSKQEGLPEDQWCYGPNWIGVYAEGMKLMSSPERRRGYRLPTEAEWECSCRAGTATGYSFGEPWELLEKYGWYRKNSPDRTQPVGSLKPNDFGLFDLHGNFSEWCQDRFKQPGKEEHTDVHNPFIITDRDPRVLRGGSYADLSGTVRSVYRYRSEPSVRAIWFGFRPARTYP